VISLHRRFFNDVQGVEAIQKLRVPPEGDDARKTVDDCCTKWGNVE
jgi:hypothetical protein